MKVLRDLVKILCISLGAVVALMLVGALTCVELYGLILEPHVNRHLSSGRFATLDKSGKLTLWPENTYALSNFCDGFAVYREYQYPIAEFSASELRQPLLEMGSGGLIDYAGRKYPFKMWWIYPSSRLAQGLINVEDPYSKKYCYIGLDGNKKIAQEFSMAAPFSEGLAAVSVEPLSYQKNSRRVGKWGYIDSFGKFVIPPQYAVASNFVAGRAFVEPIDNFDKTYCIDKTGKTIFANTSGELSEFTKDGIAISRSVARKSHSGDVVSRTTSLVDTDGKTIKKGVAFRSFSEGMGEVINKNEFLEFADKQGKIILRTRFKANWFYPVEFGDNIAAIALDEVELDLGKYAPTIYRLGFIDKKGKLQNFSFGNRIITAAYPFVDDHAVVKTFVKPSVTKQ
ncbi:MAG: WG repeat-containing protein [Candidatus Obscuribacterales bacterium]|nr:WG repeat-containing protein [Candidatus Obscuribacterales bacterium]